jgi:hypothetical protein
MAPDDDLPPDYEPPDFSVDMLEDAPSRGVVRWFERPRGSIAGVPIPLALTGAFALGVLATAFGFLLAARLRDDD